MALYVAVCLLAALIAIPDDGERAHTEVFALVWGTTLGLAIAHWFAFRLSARVVAGGGVTRADAAVSVAQLAGAIGVAALTSVPILLLPVSSEFDAARLVLAAFVAVVGFQIARSSGAPLWRSTLYGVVVLAGALATAVVKNVLSHH